MLTLPSACPLDCPDSCTLDVDVEGGRVTAVRGSERSELTGGVLCGKVSRFAEHMYCPERLLHPMRRVGPKGEGAFQRISWDEALDTIAERFAAIRAESGGEALLPGGYGGSNGYLTQDSLDARFFHRIGATNLKRTLCAMPSSAAQRGLYGRMPGGSLEDVPEARLVVLWGVNPSATGIHLVSRVQEAQRRGAKLVVVDPRRIPLARRADLHLALRPGTDLVVALAVAHVLFEEGLADLDFLAAHATGVDEFRRRAAVWTPERAEAEAGLEAGSIRGFARLYAAASPALIRCGWGPERSRNGGAGTAAVLALPAVAGKFGVRGGGYTMSNSGAWALDPLAGAGAQPPSTRWVNLARLGRALTELDDPPIRGLFVYNGNPLATCPDQGAVARGLAREDLFTVVFDQVMTDTARWADILLPATTFLEHDELMRGYGNMVLHRVRPVAEPVGEARSNNEVFAALCARMGLDEPDDAVEADAIAEAVLASDAQGRGAELQEALREPGAVARPAIGGRPVQFVDHFPRTADRKVHLVPEVLERETTAPALYSYLPDPAREAYPLALISPAVRSRISSTFGQLEKAAAALWMHPDDAEARGLRGGSVVRVWNALGEVEVALRVTDATRPGVVVLPKGLWARHTKNGRTANALIPQDLTDLGEAPVYNDARVEVAAL